MEIGTGLHQQRMQHQVSAGYGYAWDGDLTLNRPSRLSFRQTWGRLYGGSNAGVLYSNVTNGYPSLNVGFRAALVV